MTTSTPEVLKSSRYSISDAARLLGVHRNTIRNAMKRGHLVYHIGINGRSFITGKSILDFWNFFI